MSRKALALAVAITAIRWPVAALDVRAGTLELDPAKTRVEFSLGATLHTVHGTFNLIRGVIRVDPNSGDAGGIIEIDAGSGDSGNGRRDSRMKSEILETARYPRITFTPTRADDVHLEPDGAFRAVLHGRMALHGGEHEMKITVSGHVTVDEVTATGRFLIPYVAWGMTDPSMPLLTVAKEVEVDVTTAGHVVWAP